MSHVVLNLQISYTDEQGYARAVEQRDGDSGVLIPGLGWGDLESLDATTRGIALGHLETFSAAVATTARISQGLDIRAVVVAPDEEGNFTQIIADVTVTRNSAS